MNLKTQFDYLTKPSIYKHLLALSTYNDTVFFFSNDKVESHMSDQGWGSMPFLDFLTLRVFQREFFIFFGYWRFGERTKVCMKR